MLGLMRDTAGFDPGALSSLPVFPLPNCVLLPGGLLPLLMFEPRYRELTRDCLAGHQLMGVARAEIARELPAERTYRLVEARALDDASYDPVDAHDHLHRLIKLCDRLAEVIPKGGSELRDLVRTFDAPGACADAVAAALVMDADARQELLEARDPMVRLQRTLGHVSHLLCELAPCHGAVN